MTNSQSLALDFSERVSTTVAARLYHTPFLEQWHAALAAYGDKLPDFSTLSCSYEMAAIDGTPHRFCLISPTLEYRERRKRLLIQETYWPRNTETITHHYGMACRLCENIAQAVDAQHFLDVPNNALGFFPGYVLLPNRYPAFPGSSLLVPMKHDSAAPRNAIGSRSLRTSELLLWFSVCDRFRCVGQRNHVRDSMSIPGHDHFQLIPDSFPWYARLLRPPRASSACYEDPRNPFSVLVLESHVPNALARRAAAVLKRLDAAEEVYTLLYAKGRLFISARRTRAITTAQIQLELNVPLLMRLAPQRPLEESLHYLPRRGEFNWDRFLPSVDGI